MGVRRKIGKYVWNLISMNNDIPAHDTLKYLDFMTYSGNGCTPGFTVDLSSYKGIENVYYKCSPLSTIIGNNASAMANAKWWITNEKDDEVSGYDNLKRLLKQPNPLQSWTEFIIQLDTYRQLYGEVFVYALVSPGFTNEEASALWVLNPEYVYIEQTNKLYLQSRIEDIISGYKLILGDKEIPLDTERVLHIKDSYQNLSFSDTDIHGASRVLGLEDHIKNIIQANEAIYSLNKDRGALGILTNKSKDSIGTIPMSPEEQKEIHRKYNTEYGIGEGKNKIVVTSADLDFLRMSFNTKDLMLFEGISKNIEQIADAYRYPFGLLGGGEGSIKYNNMTILERKLYQDNIIPVSLIYSEKLTSFFGLDDINIYADFSGVSALKEDEEVKARTLNTRVTALLKAYQAGAISMEEFRTGLDMNTTIEGTTMYNINDNETAEEG